MFAVAAGALIALLAAQSRLQHQQRDRGGQSAGEDADLCGCNHLRRRERIEARRQSCCCCSTGVASVLARYSFVLHSSPRPTVFLTWLIIPGIVYAWRRGERLAAIQALLLLLAAIGIDALGVRRGLKSEYFIFTDPLIILAGAILLDRLTRSALSQMDLSDRHGPVRTAYRRRPGRADQIRLHAHGARNRSASGTAITCRCCRCPGAALRRRGHNGLLRGGRPLVWIIVAASRSGRRRQRHDRPQDYSHRDAGCDRSARRDTDGARTGAP